MGRDVAKILYDGYGQAHSVIVGDTIFSNTPGLIMAGTDENSEAAFLALSSDGEMLTATKNSQKKYDISDYGAGTTYTYIGAAERGLATSSTGWTIKRFSFLDGELREKTETDTQSAVWDNRAFEIYS